MLTHLARNADGLARLVRWAETGERTPMYASAEASGRGDRGRQRTPGRAAAGGPARRRGGARPAASPVWRAAAGDAIVEIGPSRTPIPGSDLAWMRVREVVMHHADLDLGYTWDRWPQDFTVRSLDELAPRSASRGLMPVGHLVDSATELVLAGGRGSR